MHVPTADQSDDLCLAAPIASWDDAIPLGNGMMGGLLWGEDGCVRLSLDRGDLWDERTTGEAEWWKKHPWASADGRSDPWDQYYEGVTPTKLPAGRLEVAVDPTRTIKDFGLRFATAEGVVSFDDGAEVRAVFSATEPVALLRFTGVPVAGSTLIPAGSGGEAGETGPSSGGAVAALGYPAADRGRADDAQWYVQQAAEGFAYCTYVATRQVGEDTLLAVAITSSDDCGSGEDVLEMAAQRCERALSAGYAETPAAHAAWWAEFWDRSSVEVPEPHIRRSYLFARYLYGSGSRQGAPPMPLQGVWTADNGGLPPWKGDYHNDLNTQVTYGAYQASGDFESGGAYLEFLWKLTPVFRRFAEDFYGTGGLATPGVMSLAGQPMGGWGQYSMSPTMSAWNAHLFYLHWRYTGDDEFLRERAYPWSAEVGRCMAGLLTPDDSGVLVLPLSSSPEIYDNEPRAWLRPNSNYDLMCLLMLFRSLQEMAEARQEATEAEEWGRLADGLGHFHAAADGELLLDAELPLRESHRHLSHLIGVHPFNLVSVDGGERDEQRIRASLAVWDELGTGEWCGYTWSWMSALRARVGDGEAAVRHLDVFARAFVSRNGFHVNGDQSGGGFSKFTYRPFTLEGNFAAMQAVHEMLLQSWSPTPGRHDTGTVRLFPAVPWRWHDAAFSDLRAEGGHRVSARRENNATTWFRIVAGKDGLVRLRDNFGGAEPRWCVSGVEKVGKDFQVWLRKGEVLEGELDRPGEVPAEPADLAAPVVIGGAGGAGVS
jgi:alpha-L-fucosidase 2